jgi:hypothetical protein
MNWLAVLLVALVFGWAPTLRAQGELGATEGRELSPYDLDRVVAGVTAPDFRLQDQDGNVHQLSQYRGKNVVLVMYRGWW